MLGSSTLQWLIFPFGVLYLVLHAGPLLRIVYEPSIRGGTRWQFFASEVALFVGYLLCAPAIVSSRLGVAVLALHLSMHVAFTITDYLAHEFLLGSALVAWAQRPFMWIAKELGLLIDTATHAIAVGLIALTLPKPAVVALAIPALVAFALVTRGYVQRYGDAS